MMADRDARIEGDQDRNGGTRPRRSLRSSVVLFLVAAIGFVLWRAPINLVWDDSPTVSANLYPPDGGPTYSLDDPRFYPALWHEVFGHLQMDGYRPFNWALRRLGAAAHAKFAWATEAFQPFNSAGNRPERIIRHLGDVHATIFIPRHGHGTDDIRLGGD